jgi:hypothetical protein
MQRGAPVCEAAPRWSASTTSLPVRDLIEEGVLVHSAECDLALFRDRAPPTCTCNHAGVAVAASHCHRRDFLARKVAHPRSRPAAGASANHRTTSAAI